jgi:hypothetical protein
MMSLEIKINMLWQPELLNWCKTGFKCYSPEPSIPLGYD